jgi:peptide deformylase
MSNETLKITPFGIQEIRITELIPENDKRLKMISKEWDFNNPPENAVEFSRELINTCKAYGGLGLSAIQIGKPYRVFCIGLIDQFQICFNPKILKMSLDKKRDIEGCLSFPGLALTVERSTSIDVEFQMPDGVVKQETFHGLTSICFQHEVHHLDGICFTDMVGPLSLQRAREARRKLIKQIERRKKKL